MMPVVESDDSRSVSSDNESNDDEHGSYRDDHEDDGSISGLVNLDEPNVPRDRSDSNNSFSSHSGSNSSLTDLKFENSIPNGLPSSGSDRKSPLSPSISERSFSVASDGDHHSNEAIDNQESDEESRRRSPSPACSVKSDFNSNSSNSNLTEERNNFLLSSSKDENKETQKDTNFVSTLTSTEECDNDNNKSIDADDLVVNKESKAEINITLLNRSSKSSSSGSSSSSSGSSNSSKASDVSSNKSTDSIPFGLNEATEDVSDGDMESDHGNEELKCISPSVKTIKNDVNITHDDLSDVSDLEDSIGDASDVEKENDNQEKMDTSNAEIDKIQNDSNVNMESQVPNKSQNDSHKPDDVEEPLDFEAEDGECPEIEMKTGNANEDKKMLNREQEAVTELSKSEAVTVEKELEEGEVTDEDDARPEETEPRPVCRFFSRGACTWGASCRFLHPGVTDKGNYTMFDMVRPVLTGEYGAGRMLDDRMYGKADSVIESPWERGLKSAKEMLKKSIRRKEQDIDFEEKKMNLSIAQEEFDKENGYYGRIPSPEPRYVRHLHDYPVARGAPVDEYYARRQIVYEPDYPPQLPSRREHLSRSQYREVIPHHRTTPPDYYGPKYAEELPLRNVQERDDKDREIEKRKPKREVIVQRASEENRSGRADDWQDPWMRSKSPGKRKDRKKSYSSGSSSYSTSSSRSSSRSSKSSYGSRSHFRKERSKTRTARHVSPSVIVSERKAANERAALMNPPAPKRKVPSPGMRVSNAANPPAPSRDQELGRIHSNKLAVAAAIARVKNKSKHTSRASSSGSSTASSSDSESSDSSSSSSRSNSPVRESRKASDIVKAMDALRGSSALEKNKIKLNLKNTSGTRRPDNNEIRKTEGSTRKRTTTSPISGDLKTKKRREALLKQLKAVEDAIAKKRSKV